MVDVPADTIRIQASTDTEGVQSVLKGVLLVWQWTMLQDRCCWRDAAS